MSTAVAQELRSAPTSGMPLIEWLYSSRHCHLVTIVEAIIAEMMLPTPWDDVLISEVRRLLPDAITEAIETEERLAAIDACRHHHVRWSHPAEGEACRRCGGEYHGGEWI